MTTSELVKALRRMAAETGSLPCQGCGHERSCGVHGCAVLREAAAELERLEAAAQRLGQQACDAGFGVARCEVRDCAHWLDSPLHDCDCLTYVPGRDELIGECHFDLKQGAVADENHG